MKRITKNIIVIILIIAFGAADFVLPGYSAKAGDNDKADIQNSIDKASKQLDATQKQLEKSQAQYQNNQKQISATKSQINKTQEDITRKQQEVDDLSKRIEANRMILEGYIQEMSMEGQSDPLVTFVSSNESLSDFVGNFDQMIGVKGKVLEMMDEINQEKNELNGVLDDLAAKKDQSQDFLSDKQSEQADVASDIQEAKATISELNSKLDSLRSKLSSLLGSVSTDDIIEAAGIASKATGVRKDFIIGELVVESDMGKFTGGCTFDKSKMGSTNASIFKRICSDLDYNYKKMKVSCPLSYGIGGAMGVAQFMPSTWQGYESRIASATGHNPPDPWNLVDGVTAMALYLKNRGADNKKNERNAAAGYYCGSNIGRAVCQNYAKKVLYWADNYEQLLGN